MIKSLLTNLYNLAVNLLVLMRPKLYYCNMLIKQPDAVYRRQNTVRYIC